MAGKRQAEEGAIVVRRGDGKDATVQVQQPAPIVGCLNSNSIKSGRWKQRHREKRRNAEREAEKWQNRNRNRNRNRGLLRHRQVRDCDGGLRRRVARARSRARRKCSTRATVQRRVRSTACRSSSSSSSSRGRRVRSTVTAQQQQQQQVEQQTANAAVTGRSFNARHLGVRQGRRRRRRCGSHVGVAARNRSPCRRNSAPRRTSFIAWVVSMLPPACFVSFNARATGLFSH